MPRRARAVLLMCAAGGLASCNDAGAPPFDRSMLLDEVTTTLIVPSYEDAMTAGATVQRKTHALCDAPSSTTLRAARDAWRDAMVAWDATSPFALDASLAITANVDANLTAPAAPDRIEALLTGTSPLDETSVAALGPQERGYHALEYLLFAYPDFTARDDGATLTALGENRRCEYARAVADEIATSTAAVHQDWETRFARELTVPDGNPYSEPQTAVNALIDGIAHAIDRTRDVRLGRPLGRTAHPGSVESPYAGISALLMQTTLESSDHAWSMTPHSIDALLSSRNAAVADDVRAEFASARAALATLDSPPLAVPFEQYVAGTDRDVGDAAYAEMVELQNIIGADVSSVLGHNVFLQTEGD